MYCHALISSGNQPSRVQALGTMEWAGLSACIARHLHQAGHVLLLFTQQRAHPRHPYCMFLGLTL
jgi:hypothetical protein